MSALRLFGLGLVFAATSFAAVYSPEGAGLRLEYDERLWEVSPRQAAEAPGTTPHKTLAALQRKAPDDRYHARFSVVTESLDAVRKKAGKRDLLDAYHEHAIEFLKSQRFADIESERRSGIVPAVPGPAWETTASHRDFGLKFRQIVFLAGDRAYLVTMAARPDKFFAYEADFRKLVGSLKLVDPKS